MPLSVTKPQEYLTTVLGKITHACIQHHDKIGHLEVSFTLGGNGWGVGDDFPLHDAHLHKLDDLMRCAKVSEFSQLVGKPIEATLDGNLLKSWRILTEVL